MSVKIPLVAAHNAKQKNSPPVCETADDLCKNTAVASNKVCSDKISSELLLSSEKSNSKPNEIEKMETVLDAHVCVKGMLIYCLINFIFRHYYNLAYKSDLIGI